MEDKKEVKVESVSINGAKVSDGENENVVTETPEELKIKELTVALAELNDKYLRTAAELENTRRRAAIDSETRARARAMLVAEKILPVMDAVDAALKHSPDDEGIQSLARALGASFAEIGVTKIETLGKTLDPTKHNAIQVVPAGEGVEPNTVVEEMQPGYMFGDNVLRTAMVVVAK
jgi:molecular chaperone GrpE